MPLNTVMICYAVIEKYNKSQGGNCIKYLIHKLVIDCYINGQLLHVLNFSLYSNTKLTCVVLMISLRIFISPKEK